METKTKKVYPRVHTNKGNLFTFVELDQKKVVICVGQQKVSEKEFTSIQNAISYVNEKPWELICNVSSLVSMLTFKNLKEKEDKNEKTD